MSLRGFRDRVTAFVAGVSRLGKPVIQTEYGTVTEEMRLQAAMNMRLDPVKRMQVETMLSKQYGSVARGLAEARRRYPEAYTDKELRQ